MERKRTGKRVFTLIELLVVIAIIAILAGMLLPALNRARATALGIACISKMKQGAMTFQLYEGDYKGFMPGVGYMGSDYNTSFVWLFRVTGYLAIPYDSKKATHFICELTRRQMEAARTIPRRADGSSYYTGDTNFAIVGNKNYPSTVPEYYNKWGCAWQSSSVPRNPSGTMVFFKPSTSRYPSALGLLLCTNGYDGTTFLYQHNKGVNLAFCDGSAAHTNFANMGYYRKYLIWYSWPANGHPNRKLNIMN